MKYDVFISYSSKDQKVAEGICGFLESNGYRCFVAYRDISRGVVWAGAIADAIDESQMMVVVFSNAFNVSTQTDREIELAAENNIPILTYRITEDKFKGAKKYYLKNLNWIDAFPNPEQYFGNLLHSVNQLVSRKQGYPNELLLPSGLRYIVIKEGVGIKPNLESIVQVHYEGMFLDGSVFDSSIQRGQPATFPLDQVIEGWVEGIQLMKEGAKYKFIIPPHLAYGETGAGKTIPPNTTLVFDVELIKVFR